MTARQPRASEPHRHHGAAGGRCGSNSMRCKSRTQTATISKTTEWKKIRHQLQQNKHHEDSKFYATSTSSSTLPQPKRKMQEEKKRMQVNQDMADKT